MPATLAENMRRSPPQVQPHSAVYLRERPVKVDGRCHCGAIAFEAEIDPARVTICHCTDCQMLTGTAFRTTVPAPVATFVLRSGTPKTYLKTTADSGPPRL